MVNAYYPWENLYGYVEVVVEFLIRIVWIYWIRIRVIRICWVRMTELSDLVNAELVNVVTNDCKLHTTHLSIVTIVIVTVPIVVVCVVLAVSSWIVTGEAGCSIISSCWSLDNLCCFRIINNSIDLVYS